MLARDLMEVARPSIWIRGAQHAREQGTAALAAPALPGDPRGAPGRGRQGRRGPAPGRETDADPSRAQSPQPGLREAQHQARRSVARQPPSPRGATGHLPSVGAVAARGDAAADRPRRLGRLRAGPRLADAASRRAARRPGGPDLRRGAPAATLQQPTGASPLSGAPARRGARDLLADPDHRCGVPRAVVPRGRALRVGLDRARPQPGQVPARRRRVGLHDGAVSSGDADLAAPRPGTALASATLRLSALPGAPVSTRARPAAQGARAELERAAVPEAVQGPVAARDLTAPRPRRSAARGEALRAPDADRGGHPRYQEPALGLRPAVRSQPPRRAPGALAPHRRSRHAGVLARRPRGRDPPLGAALSSEHPPHAGRLIDRLPRPAAAHQPAISTPTPRVVGGSRPAPLARRSPRDGAVTSWGSFSARAQLRADYYRC